MPWIAVVCLCLVAACRFEADYAGGKYLCRDSDHSCPPDLECRLDLMPPECREKRTDAAIDTPLPDDAPDGRMAALTCGDPGMLTSGVATTGTTMGRSNTVQPMCGGFGMFAADAVYRIDAAAGKQLTVTISANFQAAAYVVQPCNAAGCVGNSFAQPNSPVTVTVLAGAGPFVVVDSNFAAGMGDYTLTVTVN